MLRECYGIPGVIVKASSFTNPQEERRRDPAYHRREAKAYLRALRIFEPTLPPEHPHAPTVRENLQNLWGNCRLLASNRRSVSTTKRTGGTRF